MTTEPPTVPAPARRSSIGDLFRQLVDDIINLVRSELKLARAELTSTLRQSAGSFAAIAVGGMLAMVAGTCLLIALIVWLAAKIGLVAATLSVAGVSGAGAAILIAGGVAKLQQLDLAPKQATANLKRNAEMLKGD
jgi:predicted phage tail protein